MHEVAGQRATGDKGKCRASVGTQGSPAGGLRDWCPRRRFVPSCQSGAGPP